MDKTSQKEEEKVEKTSLKKEEKVNKRTDDSTPAAKIIKGVKKVNFNEQEDIYKLHIEADDCNNDTDLVVNEDVNVDEFALSQNNNDPTAESDDDSNYDIPLSQVKNGDRMVQYHESLQIDTESDEFSLGTEDDNVKEEVVTEIIQALDESIEGVKSQEMAEDVGTARRMEGVRKSDEGR